MTRAFARKHAIHSIRLRARDHSTGRKPPAAF